jgi:light-regulated signal transduction histidine kinase (bacteriophytochrome)
MMVLTLLDPIQRSGGLFSDNLLWLLGAPLLALLFANRGSGFCWLIFLLGVSVYYFILEENFGFSFRQQTAQFGSLYYLVSYSGLFIFVTAIVLLFAKGQEMIIGALFEKQQELMKQKIAISEQAQSLKEAESKLLATNKELEQFAYAASHDLKEPLRMIGTYVQLIQRRLNGNIDGNTTEYMHFVTDGVTRMDKLLTDLLDYSRLGRRKESNRETNLDEVLYIVINNLMATMKETDAAIYSNSLPSVIASSTEMIQLFQNLIANSIKFRQKNTAPVIEISHTLQKDSHLFYLKDNGIGIPAEHSKSVFNIFERLHSRQEYEGTGIGLATCKKIINNLGGDIWVESSNDPGTTFFFTIPRKLGKAVPVSN